MNQVAAVFLICSREQFVLSSEHEMLREEDEAKIGERTPFTSSRQATYEDSVPPKDDWENEDS
jgi:hypothetical protein